MAVGIGFDDGDQAGLAADPPADGADVLAQGFQVDLNPATVMGLRRHRGDREGDGRGRGWGSLFVDGLSCGGALEQFRRGSDHLKIGGLDAF